MNTKIFIFVALFFAAMLSLTQAKDLTRRRSDVMSTRNADALIERRSNSGDRVARQFGFPGFGGYGGGGGGAAIANANAVSGGFGPAIANANAVSGGSGGLPFYGRK